MGEGYWIRPDGAFQRITEHAQWIQVAEHARWMGLGENAIARIQAIPWDRGDGPNREAIVREAVAQGLIRFRDHGPFVTFEFAMPLEAALEALGPFMSHQLGPSSNCRLNRLDTGEAWAMTYSQILALLAEGSAMVDPSAARRSTGP